MPADTKSFCTQLRKETRKIHSVSDALVNAKFAIALRDETVWGGGLFVFYHVFAFLEDAQERLNIPEISRLYFHKTLFRKKAFESDLEHYLGVDWKRISKSQALENYLEHLKYLEKEDPLLLMAYVYHLYLGLLSGGQILAKKRKMFGKINSTKDEYTDAVTDFSDVDIPQLKNDFRAAMDEVAEKLSIEDRDRLVEESKQVFLMNNLIVNSVRGQNQVLGNLLFKASAVILLVIGVIVACKMHK